MYEREFKKNYNGLILLGCSFLMVGLIMNVVLTALLDNVGAGITEIIFINIFIGIFDIIGLVIILINNRGKKLSTSGTPIIKNVEVIRLIENYSGINSNSAGRGAGDRRVSYNLEFRGSDDKIHRVEVSLFKDSFMKYVYDRLELEDNIPAKLFFYEHPKSNKEILYQILM